MTMTHPGGFGVKISVASMKFLPTVCLGQFVWGQQSSHCSCLYHLEIKFRSVRWCGNEDTRCLLSHFVPILSLQFWIRCSNSGWFLILCFLFFLSFGGTPQDSVGLLKLRKCWSSVCKAVISLKIFTGLYAKNEDVLCCSASRIKTSFLN